MSRSRRTRSARVAAGAGCAALVAGCALGSAGQAGPADTPPRPQRTVTVTASPSATGDSPSATPSTGGDWNTLFEDVESGVVRLQVSGCDASWVGTGFVVDEKTIVTAGHVADGASTISVKGTRGITRADVVGSSLSSDTAVLRTQDPLLGHVFRIASEDPGPGTNIILLGFPFGVEYVNLNEGSVSSGDTSVTYEGEDGEDGFTVDRVVTTDAAANGGNSGGPALDRDGEVVGLVSGGRYWTDDHTPAQGTNYLVPASVIEQTYADLRDDSTRPPASCPGDEAAPVEDEFQLDVSIQSDDPVAEDVTQTLFVYGDSINRGSYDAAWSTLTPAMQGRMGDFEQWSDGLDSSYWDQLEVTDVDRDDDAATVRATFRTIQDASAGRDGQECSDWDMTYRMQLDQGTWLIDATDLSDGYPRAC